MHLELLIYDIIGDWWEGTRAVDIARELLEHPSATQIDVYVNSDGGDVFEGVAIYNALVRHQARTIVHVDGKALSIASAIVQAGDERRIATGAMMMIHEPWGFQSGTAEDMRRYADFLDENRGGLAGIYAARSGKTADEVEAWMQAETWFNAESAVAEGLADQIVEAAGAEFQALASARAAARAQPPGSGARRTAYALRVAGRAGDRAPVITRKNFAKDKTMSDNTSPWQRFLAKWNALLSAEAKDDLDVMLSATQLKAQADEMAAFGARNEVLEAENEQLKARINVLEAGQAEQGAAQEVAQEAEDEVFLASAVKEFRIEAKSLGGDDGWSAQMAANRDATRKAVSSIPKGTHDPNRTGAPNPPEHGGQGGQAKGRARVAAAVKVAS